MESEIENGFLLTKSNHSSATAFFQELERVKKKFPNLFRSAMYMGGYWASILEAKLLSSKKSDRELWSKLQKQGLLKPLW